MAKENLFTYLLLKDMNLGCATEALLKELQKKDVITAKQVKDFREEARLFVVATLKKLIQKSPLASLFVHHGWGCEDENISFFYFWWRNNKIGSFTLKSLWLVAVKYYHLSSKSFSPWVIGKPAWNVDSTWMILWTKQTSHLRPLFLSVWLRIIYW